MICKPSGFCSVFFPLHVCVCAFKRRAENYILDLMLSPCQRGLLPHKTLQMFKRYAPSTCLRVSVMLVWISEQSHADGAQGIRGNCTNYASSFPLERYVPCSLVRCNHQLLLEGREIRVYSCTGLFSLCDAT